MSKNELNRDELKDVQGGKSAGAGQAEGKGYSLSFQKTWNHGLVGGAPVVNEREGEGGGGILPPQGPSDQPKIQQL